MVQYLISYELQGPDDAPETGLTSSYELPSPGEEPTVAALRESFPYLGTFHFRAKIPLDKEEYAWLDLTEESDLVPIWSEDRSGGGGERMQHIHIRALPLSFEGGPEGEGGGDMVDEEAFAWGERDLEDQEGGLDSSAGQYGYEGEEGEGVKMAWNKIKEATENVLTSEVAKDLTKKGIKVGKSVGKQVGKLWSSIKAAATDSGQSSPPNGLPGPVALENLASLESMVTVNLSDTNRQHGSLLAQLWARLFPGTAYERPSARWRTAGFQSDDPIPDFRGTGLLCLQCMITFATDHQPKMQQILREQSARSSKNYPFAVVANNVTLMLIDLLKLRDSKYVSSPAAYWMLFESSRGAFQEIFNTCLYFVDRQWVERGITRDQFPKLIQYTRQHVEQTLSLGPTSLQHLTVLAERSGMV